MPPVKIGILSAAMIANDMVVSLRNLSEKDYKIVAVGASNLESAQRFAKKFGIPKAYGSYLELCKDEDVQLVYVANVNIYHYSAARMALEHGKHVLVEKPFTIDVPTTKELFDLAKQKGLYCAEALWTRYLPAYQKVRAIIKSGQLGDIIHVATHFIISNSTDRMLYKKLGGGVTLDIGCYAINCLLEGVGYTKPARIRAFGRSTLPGESETSISAIFDFPNECTGQMLLTARADGNSEEGNNGGEHLTKLQQVLYLGTKGQIRINDWINNPESFELTVDGVTTVVDTNCKDKQTDNYIWPNSAGLWPQVKHAIDCINQGKIASEVHPPEHTIVLAEVMAEVIKEAGFDVIQTPTGQNFKTV